MLHLDLQCDKEKRWNAVDLMQILHRGEKTTFQLMGHFLFMGAMSDHVLHWVYYLQKTGSKQKKGMKHV